MANLDMTTIGIITTLLVFFTQIGTAFSYYWKLREKILQLENRVENLEKIYPKIDKISDDLQTVKEELKVLIARSEIKTA